MEWSTGYSACDQRMLAWSCASFKRQYHDETCRALGTWRRGNVPNSKIQLDFKEKVDNLYSSDETTTEDTETATKTLHEALKTEKTLWRQKSRIIWLREGDRNSKFFHTTMKQRRAHNRITRLIDDQGRVKESEEGIMAIPTRYFRGLFEIPDPSEINQA